MLKPSDIEEIHFKSVPLGYSPEEVEECLEAILADYGVLYTENIELRDKLGVLNENVDYYRSIEKSLQNTLVLAEKAAEETREAATAKGEQLVREAELRAGDMMRAAQNELFYLEQEMEKLKNRYELMRTRVKLLLYAELELIDKNDIFAEKDEDAAKDRIKLSETL